MSYKENLLTYSIINLFYLIILLSSQLKTISVNGNSYWNFWNLFQLTNRLFSWLKKLLHSFGSISVNWNFFSFDWKVYWMDWEILVDWEKISVDWKNYWMVLGVPVDWIFFKSTEKVTGWARNNFSRLEIFSFLFFSFLFYLITSWLLFSNQRAETLLSLGHLSLFSFLM